MDELRELYQQVIIDHNRNPRNCGKLDCASRVAQGFNPLCGDKLTLYLEMADDKIQDVRFDGSGCAISVASASLMTEAVKGMTLPEANALFKQMHHFLTVADDDEDIDVGKLQVLAGVKAFPTRVKCATLAWHTLDNALNEAHAVASTE